MIIVGGIIGFFSKSAQCSRFDTGVFLTNIKAVGPTRRLVGKDYSNGRTGKIPITVAANTLAMLSSFFPVYFSATLSTTVLRQILAIFPRSFLMKLDVLFRGESVKL